MKVNEVRKKMYFWINLSDRRNDCCTLPCNLSSASPPEHEI